MATAEHGMTTTEATVLTTARAVLRELEQDAEVAATGASSTLREQEPRAQDYGRMAEACSRASEGIDHVLAVAADRCGMRAAEAANDGRRR